MPKKMRFLGMLPAAVYTVIYLINVVIRQAWPDFYAFNVGGFWYISGIIINIITYLFSSFLWEANHHKHKSNAGTAN